MIVSLPPLPAPVSKFHTFAARIGRSVFQLIVLE